MAIWNLGSVNIDYVLHVAHMPKPGETLTAIGSDTGLGGKGANQSVAAARAGARVHHIGMAGRDGALPRRALEGAGVDVDFLDDSEAETGRAQILVDAEGENVIVILPGANARQSPDRIDEALEQASPGDTLLLQNETSHQSFATGTARRRELRVVYSAAPFEAAALFQVMGEIDVLLLNAVEAAQLTEGLGHGLSELPVGAVVVTKGAGGATWHDIKSGERIHVDSPAVEAVDTTGAGDCLAGYLAAGLDRGEPPETALQFATAAAALSCTRFGASQAVPDRGDVESFLSEA